MKYFPYEKIRSGQKEFMDDIQTALSEQKHLVAHAPTGIGKTVSVLSVVIPFCLENKKKLVYLVPKQTQHKIVVETIKHIVEKSNLKLKVVDFIGKQAMCPNSDINNDFPIVFNLKCKNFMKHKACSYYENTKCTDMIPLKQVLNVEELCNVCSQNMALCPYQIAIKSLSEANIIICDYNHLFTGLVAKMSGVEYKDMIIVFDEAHNLPDRSRDHQSGILTRNTIQNAINENKYDPDNSTLVKRLDMLLSLFDREKYILEGNKENEKIINQGEFIDDVQKMISSVIGDGEISYTEFVEYTIINTNDDKPYTNKLGEFLGGWDDIMDATFRVYSEYTTRDDKQVKSTKLEYRGLDPSLVVFPIAEQTPTMILMSGTLYPMSMYRDLTGLEPKRTMLREYRSPFPEQNKLSLVTKYITSQYKKRCPAMYMDIASMIHRVVDFTPGSSAIFFTSYSFMDDVINRLPTFTKNKIVLEKRDMTKRDKDRMYDFLSRRGGVLCAVMAGSLSEGYDYQNNVIKSIVLVGMPLSPPTIDSRNLIEFYSQKFGKDLGEKYGYIYPCLRAVLQAAGRGIRGPDDRCCIVYADYRYTYGRYATFFDEKLIDMNMNDVIKAVKDFWSGYK